MICLIAEGHLLLDDLPAVGKTLLARTIAQSIGAVFKRLQFTPDLLPTDITGASIYDRTQGGFRFVPGPIFANIVLADEINRAGTRTQSALLEAMGEGQVTADGESQPAKPKPFCVVATQNEVDPYGTFPLPYAQLDRFLMLLSIGYPGEDQQVLILERNERGQPDPTPRLTAPEVCEIQAQMRLEEVAHPGKQYMARLLAATREHPDAQLGGSPRAGVQLQRAAQARAPLSAGPYVIPEDVEAVAVPVLSHRLILEPGSSLASTGDLVEDALRRVPVPA